MIIPLEKSTRKHKKFMVKVKNKTVHFGDDRFSDFTKHNDKKRKQLYINRHSKNEDWDKSGIDTPGFWSKHLLWNKDTLDKRAISCIIMMDNVSLYMCYNLKHSVRVIKSKITNKTR